MPKLGGDEPKKISGANAPTSSPQTWFGGYAPAPRPPHRLVNSGFGHSGAIPSPSPLFLSSPSPPLPPSFSPGAPPLNHLGVWEALYKLPSYGVWGNNASADKTI